MLCTRFVNKWSLPQPELGLAVWELVSGQPYALSEGQVQQFFNPSYLENALTVVISIKDPSCLNSATPIAACFWRIVLDEAELDYMTVANGFRGAGLGFELLSVSEQFLHLHGCVRATLEVSEKNLVAKRIYEASGYQDIGKRKGYYKNGESAWVMAKHFGVANRT